MRRKIQINSWEIIKSFRFAGGGTPDGRARDSLIDGIPAWMPHPAGLNSGGLS